MILDGLHDSSLEAINRDRLRLTRQGMTVLGAWAVGNMAVGGYFWARRTGTVQAFHQMNVLWNTVNLGLAAVGYWNAREAAAEGLDALATLQEYHSLEKLLLFNAGLDVGYMAFGLYLQERGRRMERNQFRGWGRSLVLQGAFLFLFDTGLTWMVSRQKTEHLLTTNPSMSLGLTPTWSGAPPLASMKLRF